jgi:type 1 glutamine amidotransferase
MPIFSLSKLSARALPVLLAATIASAQAPLKVLFWGGTTTTPHNPRALRDSLASFFTANNIQIHYREAASPGWLHADSLAVYDVALLYTSDQTGTNLTATQLGALTSWVASGRVIVAFHGSTNTYLNNGAVSTGWRQLLGAQFVDHDAPNHSGTCTFTVPGHPALAGAVPLPASATAEPAASNTTTYWDEGRRHNQFASDTVVIARAQLGTSNVPWIWVRPQGQGWVYYNAGGHNFRAWNREEWRGQLLKALQWGALVKTTGIRGRAALRELLRVQGGHLLLPRGTSSVRVRDMAGRNLPARRAARDGRYDLSGLPWGVYSIEVLTRQAVFRSVYVKNP